MKVKNCTDKMIFEPPEQPEVQTQSNSSQISIAVSLPSVLFWLRGREVKGITNQDARPGNQSRHRSCLDTKAERGQRRDC